MPEIKVLVVEDELLVAKDIQNTLINLGYSVPAVIASGEEAIDKVSEFKPDLVLMDIVLKGELDGIDTAKIIKERFDVPIVYLTAFGDEETLARAKITVPFGYLIKPYDKRELHSTIKMALYKNEIDNKLKENEQWLSTTLNSIGEGVISTDKKGIINFINPVAEELLGQRKDKVINRHFDEVFMVIQENTGKPIKDFLKTTIVNGQTLEVTENILLKNRDGIETPIEFIAAPNLNFTGQILGSVVVFQDISIRKQTEQVLKQSEERYRKLVDNFPEPMTVYCDGKIVYLNPETVKLFNANSTTEIIGKSIIDLIHSDFQNNIKAWLHEFEFGMEPLKDIRIKIICVDGAEKDVDISASNILYLGKPAVQIVMKDITAGRRAELVLRESEEKYRSVVERANDGICIIQDGLLKFINPSLQKMVRYELNEILETPFINYLQPKARTKVNTYYRKRMAGEDVPQIYDTIIIDKNGTEKEVEINAGIIQYQGRPGDLVIIRDIKERKAVENALRESEEKYRKLVETSPDAIVLTDLKGNITMVNKCAVSVYGCDTEEELLGKNAFEFISVNDRKRATENLQKVMKGESIKNLNYKLKHKDGSEYYGEMNTSLIVDPNNNPKGFIGIVRDISERILFEQALHESEEKYRLLVDNINDGVYTLDENGYFTFVNKVIESRSGFSEDKFKELTFKDIVEPKDIERVTQNFNKVMNGIEVPSYELEYSRSDGSKLVVEVNTKPIYKDGKIIGLQGISRNITERKKVEEKIRESETQVRNVLNSLGDAIHVVDKDLRFIMMNDSFIEWNRELGFETEIIGKKLFEIFSFLPDKIINEYKKVFKTGKPLKTEETTNIHSQELITETLKIPLIENGEVTQVITVIRDITHHKQIEMKLRENEKRYKLLFDSSPDSITLMDPSGFITDCNKATEKLLGYSKKEIIGKRFRDLLTVDPNDLPELVKKHKSLLQGTELLPYEIEIIRKDGVTRKIHVVNSILYSEDKIIGFQVISRNITEL